MTEREKLLEKAAQDFIDKVDRGAARSEQSYAAFKAALAAEPQGTWSDGGKVWEGEPGYWHDGYREGMRDASVLGHRLLEIQSALIEALGDSDITHIEGDEELRDEYPVQWAAEKIAKLIDQVADSGLFLKDLK